MAWIAGPYSNVYNSLACGQSDNSKGIRINHQLFWQDVTGDYYGDTVQDRIFQGMMCDIEFDLIQADAAAVASLQNPMTNAVYNLGAVGVPVVASGKAKTLVLTALAGSSAFGGTGTGGPNGGSPASITILAAALAPGHTCMAGLSSKLRVLPIKLAAYPVDVSGTIKFATVA